MTNLNVWQALMITMIPVAMTIANSWMLKLYEHRQNKAQLKKETDTPSEIKENRSTIFSFWAFKFPCISIAWCIICLIWTIHSPNPNHNFDALIISLDVLLIWVNFKSIVDEIQNQRFFKNVKLFADNVKSRFDSMQDVLIALTDFTKAQSEITVKQSETNEIFTKRIDALQKEQLKQLEEGKNKSEVNKPD